VARLAADFSILLLGSNSVSHCCAVSFLFQKHYCAVHLPRRPGSQHMQRRNRGFHLHVDLGNAHAECLR
jgi:hypothetical protein